MYSVEICEIIRHSRNLSLLVFIEKENLNKICIQKIRGHYYDERKKKEEEEGGRKRIIIIFIVVVVEEEEEDG